MELTGIYKIQSKVKPERLYIGSSVTIHHRWREHIRHLNNNIHSSKKLQRHFSKYGKDDLEFSILQKCSRDDLIKTEQFFIDLYQPYFNSCLNASSPLGFRHSEATKIKMSISQTGRKHSDETLELMSNAHKGNQYNKGHIFSEEHKRKIGEKHKGKYVSDEVRQKLSQSAIGKKMSLKTIIKISESQKKPILQFDLNMNLIQEWDSTKCAGDTLSIMKCNISRCLGGGAKSAGGFIWKRKSIINETQLLA